MSKCHIVGNYMPRLNYVCCTSVVRPHTMMSSRLLSRHRHQMSFNTCRRCNTRILWLIIELSRVKGYLTHYENISTMTLTLNAPIATKVVCFSRLLKCFRSPYGKQCGPRSDCSYRSSLFWSTLFASILNSSVMLGNCLQQKTLADDIFRRIFGTYMHKSLL